MKSSNMEKARNLLIQYRIIKQAKQIDLSTGRGNYVRVHLDKGVDRTISTDYLNNFMKSIIEMYELRLKELGVEIDEDEVKK